MSDVTEFTFEEVKGPEVDKFMKTKGHKEDLIRIIPSNAIYPQEFRHHLPRIIQFTVRPDDVWIVTFPKCGTTWMQEMVWLLMNNLDYETAKSISQIKRSPFFDLAYFHKHHDEDEVRKPPFLIKDLQSPRCLKSHLPLQLLPKELWTVKPKIIYVAREPKDVAVSFYHHFRLLGGYLGTCEDFVEAFLAGLAGCGFFWDHVLGFWKLRNEPNIFFTTFEEMKKDLPGVVTKVASFLNRNISSEQLERLCKHLSFESMKNNPTVSHEDEIRKRPKDHPELKGKVEPFIRKGEIGGWKSDLSPELAEKIDNWTRERLKDTDYPLSV